MPKSDQPTGLPGSLSYQEILARCIRVNQAGEYGAKRIYEGQMSVLKSDESIHVLKHMAEQEQQHLNYFNQQLVKRQIRPTLLTPIWHVAGFMLGAVTAKLGKKAAMACTVAVEEVIDEHYREQLKFLGKNKPYCTNHANDNELAEKIEQFRQEELEHRDIGLQNHAQETPFYNLLTGAIKRASKLAIFLSKRI